MGLLIESSSFLVWAFGGHNSHFNELGTYDDSLSVGGGQETEG